MPTLNYNILFDTDSDLIVSVDEMRQNYLYGIDIEDATGTQISDAVIESYIESAQKDLEDFLNLKLKPQVIEETKTYYNQDWMKWGYVPTSYPVVCGIKLDGFLGKTRQINFPREWLSTKKTSDGELYQRQINIVPSGDTARTTYSVAFAGIVPQMGLGASKTIPNYWTLKYTTGFQKIPADIINVIGRIASFGPLGIAGDLLLGAGIASQSLSMDGLSQSISTTSSAENSGYGARLRQYERELKTELPRMRDRYVGIQFGCA